MRLKILSAICSLTLTACAEIPLPKGEDCIYVHSKQANYCYQMDKDYDKNGELKKDAKIKTHPIASLADLDRFTNFSPDAWKELVAYKRKLKAAYEQQLKDCR